MFSYVCTNTIDDWIPLLLFSFKAFSLPSKAKPGVKQSAATLINANIRSLASNDNLPVPGEVIGQAKAAHPQEILKTFVDGKLQDRSITGAARENSCRTR